MIRKNFVLTLVFETPRGCGYRYGGYMLNNSHEFIRFKQKMVRLEF
jgi:hypothetical protein